MRRSFPTKNIVVIGDTIVDEFVHLTKMGDSVEGVPTYREIDRKTYSGGAANVAKHLLQLGANVFLVDNDPTFKFSYDDGFVGNVLPYNWGQTQNTSPFRHEYLVSSPVKKSRFLVDGVKSWKMNELNEFKRDFDFSGIFEACFYDPLETEFGKPSRFVPDLVVAADNRHGMFSETSAHSLVRTCLVRGLRLLVDSQMSQERPDWSWWYGCNELFLNDHEYRESQIIDGCDVHHKRGSKGSLIERLDGYVYYCTGFAHKINVVDTLGAGDAYLAAWAVSGDIRFANAWAAASCEQPGTRLPTWERVNEILA